MEKKDIKANIEKVWAKTRKDFDKIIANTQKAIEKGEEYAKQISQKSSIQIKKISLNLKKEKLYYNLGKTISSLPPSRWQENKKVKSLLEEIKKINKELKASSKK